MLNKTTCSIWKILRPVKKPLRVTFRFLKLLTCLFIIYLIIIDPATTTFTRLIRDGELLEFGVAISAPLAITISLSSLMYSRCRAIGSKLERFKSLYIAERLLHASVQYSLALCAIILMYQLSTQYDLGLYGGKPLNKTSPWILVMLPLLITFFYFLSSYFIEIYLVLSAFRFKYGGRSAKYLAPRIKRLLIEK